MCLPIGNTGLCVPPPVCPVCGSMFDFVTGAIATTWSMGISALTGFYIAFKEKINNNLSKIRLYIFT